MPWRDIEKFRSWYNTNKTKIRAYQKEWVSNNRNKVRASSRASYHNNKEKRKEKLNLLKEQAYLKVGRRCFICGIRPASRFTHFHHLEYFADSVRFTKPHKIDYQKARLEEAVAHPERFIVLCMEHHMKLEGFKTKLKNGLNELPQQLQDKIILALYNKRLF